MSANTEEHDVLDQLNAAHHQNARDKGFVDLHDRLVALAKAVREADPELADYMLQIEQGNELMLIVAELGEAHEEVRTGKYATDQTYYVDEAGEPTLERFAADGTMRKPEGLPSELADVHIRLGDTAGRRRIKLGQIVREKAEYNATRARKHGKKF